MGLGGSSKPKHKGKALVAGATTGVIEMCCTYPIEYTKIALQLNEKNASAANIISTTYRSSGLLGFYRGAPAAIYFAAPKCSARFIGYETCSSLLMDKDGSDIYGLGRARAFLAGIGAGIIEATLVSTPMETIKARFVNDAFRSDGGPPKYRGFVHGVKTIVGEQGLRGIYLGYGPTVVEVATGKGTQFGIYNLIPEENRNTPLKAAASGAFAGLTSVVLFNGIDTVKTRMQGLDAHKYRSPMHCVQELIKNEGVIAFYKGVGPRLARVTCEVALTMSIYDTLVNGLDKIWKTNS